MDNLISLICFLLATLNTVQSAVSLQKGCKDHKGVDHKKGEVYFDECSKCTCGSSFSECHTLCLPMHLTCPKGHKLIHVEEHAHKDAPKGCKCEVPRCVLIHPEIVPPVIEVVPVIPEVLPAKTKCLREREIALARIAQGVEDLSEPTCDKDGNFERFQSGWPFNKCVNPVTGEWNELVKNPKSKEECDIQVLPPQPPAPPQPPIACRKPVCRLGCPNGFEKNEHGCEICKCKKACPLARCLMLCPNGFEKNEHGCEICKCKKAKCLDTPCLLYCETGNKVDANGCKLCKCNDKVEPPAPPAPPKTKCLRERAIALARIAQGVEDLSEPTCDKDGNFELFQSGWPFNKCVNPVTGEWNELVKNPKRKEECDIQVLPPQPPAPPQPPIACRKPVCKLGCPNGFEKNEHGCEICKCKKFCPLAKCLMFCSNGFEKNEHGCEICKCKGVEPPAPPALPVPVVEPAKTKCLRERAIVLARIAQGPIREDLIEPTCDKDGNFELFQPGWAFNKCVNPVTGEWNELVENPQSKQDCEDFPVEPPVEPTEEPPVPPPPVKEILVKGEVVLPRGSPPLRDGSCLRLEVGHDAWSRDFLTTKRSTPPMDIIAEETFTNPSIEGGAIPFSLKIPIALNGGRYEFSAVLNDGWCKTEEEWIRKGDYLNKHRVNLNVNEEAIRNNVVKLGVLLSRYGKGGKGPACATPLCKIFCPNGFEEDENGCDTCKCKKACQAPLCKLGCQNGFEKDENGCEICKCKGEPSIKKKMCVYQGKSHEIGKTFVSVDCKGQCSCHEKGKGFEVRCVSLCPPMMVRCKSNEIMKHVDIPIHPGSKCTCNRPVCEAEPPKEKVCVYQGKSHKIGETFVSADCKGQCSCHEKGMGFEIRCVSLCPPMMVRCKSNEIMKHVDIPIHPGSKCTCNRPVCEPAPQERSCHFKGKHYKAGEKFISADCKGQCICNVHGGVDCVSLCPPIMIKCPRGQKLKYIDVPVEGSKCNCRQPRCDNGTPQDKTCHFKGKHYKAGEKFISADCKGQCTCNEQGGVDCVSLCPPVMIKCPRGQKLKYIDVPVQGSKCTCRQPRCENGIEEKCVDHPKVKQCGWKKMAAKRCPKDESFQRHCCATCKKVNAYLKHLEEKCAGRPLCKKKCPFGNEVDGDGCKICKCKGNPAPKKCVDHPKVKQCGWKKMAAKRCPKDKSFQKHCCATCKKINSQPAPKPAPKKCVDHPKVKQCGWKKMAAKRCPKDKSFQKHCCATCKKING